MVVLYCIGAFVLGFGVCWMAMSHLDKTDFTREEERRCIQHILLEYPENSKELVDELIRFIDSTETSYHGVSSELRNVLSVVIQK